VNIFKGEQFSEEFLRISPNNRIPAIVDKAPNGTKEPVSIFESGAILLYLAEKTGEFLPKNTHTHYEALQWLFWQVGGLGPMAGQNHHFGQQTPPIPYAVDRYVRETSRLYAVLNKQLANRDFIAKEYSIADMACYPWIVPYEKQKQNLDDFPHLKQWFLRITDRPKVQCAYEIARALNIEETLTEEAKRILSNQGAGSPEQPLIT
jgi:GST-like protein